MKLEVKIMLVGYVLAWSILTFAIASEMAQAVDVFRAIRISTEQSEATQIMYLAALAVLAVSSVPYVILILNNFRYGFAPRFVTGIFGIAITFLTLAVKEEAERRSGVSLSMSLMYAHHGLHLIIYVYGFIVLGTGMPVLQKTIEEVSGFDFGD